MKSIKGVLIFVVLALVVFWSYRMIFDLIEINKVKAVIQYLKSEYEQKGAYPSEGEFYARYLDRNKYSYSVVPVNKGDSPYNNIWFSYRLKSGWRWFAPGEPFYDFGFYRGEYRIDPCFANVTALSGTDFDGDRVHGGLPCLGFKVNPVK